MPLVAFSQDEPEMHARLKEYSIQHIRPFLSIQRKKLDEIMTAPDRKKVNNLRKELSVIIESSESPLFDISPGISSNEVVLLDFTFPFFHENEALLKQILAEAWEIANTYNSQMSPLMKDIERRSDKWQRDLEKIASGQGYSADKDRVTGVFNLHLHEILTPAFFVLWDDRGILFDYTEEEELPELFGSPTLSPNPIVDHVKLSFHLNRPSELMIVLFDDTGRSLETVRKNYTVPGEVVEEFNVGDLGSGGYFIRISSNYDSHIVRFSKN